MLLLDQVLQHLEVLLLNQQEGLQQILFKVNHNRQSQLIQDLQTIIIGQQVLNQGSKLGLNKQSLAILSLLQLSHDKVLLLIIVLSRVIITANQAIVNQQEVLLLEVPQEVAVALVEVAALAEVVAGAVLDQHQDQVDDKRQNL